MIVKLCVFSRCGTAAPANMEQKVARDRQVGPRIFQIVSSGQHKPGAPVGLMGFFYHKLEPLAALREFCFEEIGSLTMQERNPFSVQDNLLRGVRGGSFPSQCRGFGRFTPAVNMTR